MILYVGCKVAPYLWCKNNQNELVSSDIGVKLETASLASDKWVKDSKWALAKFVEYFSTGRFAENIIGFNLIYNANEWFSHHRKADDQLGWPDFSMPMINKFRQWLKNKYNNDVSLLRDSWKNENVTFDTAQVPSREQRLNKEEPTLFLSLTSVGNQVADYYMCYDELVADLGIEWCKTVKETSGGTKLAGMMHAYSYCGRFGAKQYPQHFGHGFALKIIQSPYVDFLHSPYHYYNRSVDGTHYSQHAVDSVINHGKLMVDQIDTKPFTRPADNRNADTPWETDQILKRDIMYSLSKNFANYWLEGGPGRMFPVDRSSPLEFGLLWYDDPGIKKMFSKLKILFDKNLNQGTKDVAEVAIFTSMMGSYYQNLSSVYGAMFVEIFRQWIMPHTGIPFDDYILEDIPNITKKYKVCIFMDAHYVPSTLRNQITSWLDKNNTTSIWFYAPGYLDEKGGDLKNCYELTGIILGMLKETSHLHTQVLSKSHKYLKNAIHGEFGSDIDPQVFKKDIRWMNWPYKNEDFKMNPVFYADDNSSEILGKLKNSGKSSLVVKKLKNRITVYSASPMLPADILRNIFKDSGVHLFCDEGELIYANSNFLSISCISGNEGKKVITLPVKSDVYDALSDEKLAENTDRIEVNMKYKETRIFRLG